MWILGGMGRDAGMEELENGMACCGRRRRRRRTERRTEWIFVLDNIENPCFFKITPNE